MQPNERKLLLAVAREAIHESLSGEISHTFAELELTRPTALCGSEGAFVTLKQRGISPGSPGSLRGCIGNIFGDPPLYQLIRRLACESAFSDNRFAPVTQPELQQLVIELSILSVPQPISDPELITAGRDGVLLTCGYRRAVFLPQVATEQGWDRETMLNHLAMKAGLYPTAWKQQHCTFSIFQAEICEEH